MQKSYEKDTVIIFLSLHITHGPQTGGSPCKAGSHSSSGPGHVIGTAVALYLASFSSIWSTTDGKESARFVLILKKLQFIDIL